MPSRSSQYREARHFQRTILRPLSPSAGLRTARPMCADRVGPRALRGTAGRGERHPRPHQPRRSACLVAHSLHHPVRHQPAGLRVVREGVMVARKARTGRFLGCSGTPPISRAPTPATCLPAASSDAPNRPRSRPLARPIRSPHPLQEAGNRFSAFCTMWPDPGCLGLTESVERRA